MKIKQFGGNICWKSEGSLQPFHWSYCSLSTLLAFSKQWIPAWETVRICLALDLWQPLDNTRSHTIHSSYNMFGSIAVENLPIPDFYTTFYGLRLSAIRKIRLAYLQYTIAHSNAFAGTQKVQLQRIENGQIETLQCSPVLHFSKRVAL